MQDKRSYPAGIESTLQRLSPVTCIIDDVAFIREQFGNKAADAGVVVDYQHAGHERRSQRTRASADGAFHLEREQSIQLDRVLHR